MVMQSVHRRRGVTLAVSLSVALLALVGCSSGANGGSSGGGGGGGGSSAVSITEFEGSFASLPIYVADRKGFFKGHNVATSITTVKSGSAAAQALLSGSVDMSNFAIYEGLEASLKGQKVTYIVGAATGAFGELVVGKDIPLPDKATGYKGVLRDLKGKKIGVSSKGSTTYYELAYMLRQAGLDPDKDVTIIPIGALSANRAALKAGQLAAFMSQEPVTTQVIDAGEGTVGVYIYKGSRPPLFEQLLTNGVVTTASYADSHAAAVSQVQAAVTEADNYIYNLNAADAQSLASVLSPDFPGVDVGVLGTAIVNYQKLFTPTFTAAGVQASNQLLLDAGVIKQVVPFDSIIAPGARAK